LTPDADLRTRLRAWLNERIPAGGTAADTRFSDAEIDRLITEADVLEAAAWRGWSEKAAILQEEDGGLIEKSVGSERLRLVDPGKRAAFALEMADYYYSLIPSAVGGGSKLYGYQPPDVLHTEDPAGTKDISRLLGDPAG